MIGLCATTCCTAIWSYTPTSSEPTTSAPTATPTTADLTPAPSLNPTQTPSCGPNLYNATVCNNAAAAGDCWTYVAATNTHVRATEQTMFCAEACCNVEEPSFPPTASPTASPTLAPTMPGPTNAPTTLARATIAPTNVGETLAPSMNPTGTPSSKPSEAPTTQCPRDTAGYCLLINCSTPRPRGTAFRYNCQRTCNSCRTQEIIDFESQASASALSRDNAGETTEEAPSPNDDGTSGSSTTTIVTVVLAVVLTVAALGAAYLLHSRSRSHQFEKTNAVPVDLGWDHSAGEGWQKRRAAVWHQKGFDDSVHVDVNPDTQRRSHFYPEDLGGDMTAFEPINIQLATRLPGFGKP